MDLCTGTGCIPLLFQHVFHQETRGQRVKPDLEFLGIDISPAAVQLASENLSRTKAISSALAAPKSLQQTSFVQADVLKHGDSNKGDAVPGLHAVLHQAHSMKWDILTCNPPYISPKSFRKHTARSVRRFEPRLALVPPPPIESVAMNNPMREGDTFYPHILRIAKTISCGILFVEVAHLEQALRVARIVQDDGTFDRIEIWRDEPHAPHTELHIDHDFEFKIRGTGNGRSVVCWKSKDIDLI